MSLIASLMLAQIDVDVSRDRMYAVQDTLRLQASLAKAMNAGYNQYIVDLNTNFSSVSAIIVNGSIKVDPEKAHAYNPKTNSIAYVEVAFPDTFKVHVYDLNTMQETTYILVKPSQSPLLNVVKACGNSFCGAFYFGSLGNNDILVRKFDITGIQTIDDIVLPGAIGSLDMYTSLDIFPDIVALYYRPAGNPHEFRIYHVSGVLLQNLSREVMYAGFATNGTNSYLGFVYRNGANLEADRYDINNNNFSGNIVIGVIQSQPTTGLNGNSICIADAGAGNVNIHEYDILAHTSNSYTVPLAGGVSFAPVSIVQTSKKQGNGCIVFGQMAQGITTYTGAYMFDNTPSIKDTIHFNSNIFSVIPMEYSFNDTVSMSDRIQIAYIRTLLRDTVFVEEYSWVVAFFNKEFADTVEMRVPVSTSPTGVLAFEDGNIYVSLASLNFYSSIAKLDMDLNQVWKTDTFRNADAILYLPTYVEDVNNNILKQLDKNTGTFTANQFDINPHGILLYLKEVGDTVWVITGDNANNIKIHKLLESTLSGSSIDIGFPTQGYALFEMEGRYVLLALRTNNQDANIYVYDLLTNTLNGPAVIDLSSGNDFVRKAKFAGDTVFFTINDQWLVKCDVLLNSCTNYQILSLLGSITDYVVTDNSIYVFISDGQNSYVRILDRAFNQGALYGPIAGVIDTPVFHIAVLDSQYVAYVLNEGSQAIFRLGRLQNPLQDVFYADTIATSQAFLGDYHEYMQGHFYIYLYFMDNYDVGNVYRYNVIYTQVVSSDEKISKGISYSIRKNMLILEGKGEVNLRIYDVSGRLVHSFKGYVDGTKTIPIGKAGIFVVKLNDRKFKVAISR